MNMNNDTPSVFTHVFDKVYSSRVHSLSLATINLDMEVISTADLIYFKISADLYSILKNKHVPVSGTVTSGTLMRLLNFYSGLQLSRFRADTMQKDLTTIFNWAIVATASFYAYVIAANFFHVHVNWLVTAVTSTAAFCAAFTKLYCLKQDLKRLCSGIL